jgi:uncharacterized protein (TIGR03067 family)
MRAALLMTLVLTTASAGVAAQGEKAKSELSKLGGTWVAQSREYEGKVEAKADLKGLTLVISGNRFTVKDGEGKVQLEGTLVVDAAATPKAVDVKVAGKDGKEVIYKSIYELDGDTLKTAVTQAGGDRPKGFTTKAGSNVRVTVYKRSRK